MNTTGEQVLFHGRTHPKILVRPFIAQLILLALHVLAIRFLPETFSDPNMDKWAPWVIHGAIAVAEVWYVVVPLLRWWNNLFSITNLRIENEWGIIWKSSREVATSRVTQVNIERGLLDRIFGCGTIVIHDAANAEAIRLHDVPRVKRVRRILDDLRFSTPAID